MIIFDKNVWLPYLLLFEPSTKVDTISLVGSPVDKAPALLGPNDIVHNLLECSDFVEDELIAGEDAAVLSSISLESYTKLGNLAGKGFSSLDLCGEGGNDIVDRCFDACHDVPEEAWDGSSLGGGSKAKNESGMDTHGVGIERAKMKGCRRKFCCCLVLVLSFSWNGAVYLYHSFHIGKQISARHKIDIAAVDASRSDLSESFQVRGEARALFKVGSEA